MNARFGLVLAVLLGLSSPAALAANKFSASTKWNYSHTRTSPGAPYAGDCAITPAGVELRQVYNAKAPYIHKSSITWTDTVPNENELVALIQESLKGHFATKPRAPEDHTYSATAGAEHLIIVDGKDTLKINLSPASVKVRMFIDKNCVWPGK
jgi:hypothetical protein